MTTLLSSESILHRLGEVPHWQQQEDKIVRLYEGTDFNDAMSFVNAVADLAEKADHHPDIDIRWNKVRLSLSTHSAGGLTDKDFALAKEIDAIA